MSKRQVFISHSSTDVEWVRAFAESLEAQGAQVWLDELQVRAGSRVEKALEQGLRGSDVIAFVITPDNVRRPNLLFELGAALGMGKRAVPIVSKDVPASELPYPLRVRRRLRRESPEETAKKLLAETAA
jgi:predicted nucleotide-binding protein